MYNKQLDITKIVANPEQPRREFDEAALQALADSIRERGLLQAILVEEVGDGTYILHAGERRLRAHTLLGKQSIAARVIPALNNGEGKRQRLMNALVENTMRENMSPMEEARALGDLRAMGMTIQEIVKETGINMGTVDGRLLLLRLDEPLQVLVDAGLLPRDPRVARKLLEIEDAEMRVKLGQRLARPGITINAIFSACDRLAEQIRQRASLAVVAEPMIALAGKAPKAETLVKWPNVRAAAAAMCAQCDV
ncbi:MAG: ParB/RepB/Spo0J family partition protein, partial [Nitrospiraceae bacterium]